MSFEDNVKVIDRKDYGNNVSIEVLELPRLQGALNIHQATTLFFAEQANMKLKQVRIRLRDGEVTTEAGALYTTKGHIEGRTDTSRMIGKFFKKLTTQEAMFNPVYRGTGEIYLEPRYGHFIILELSNDCVIVDKGMYYCSCGNVKVSPAIQSNLSSAALGGEGLFQTRIEGSGIVVLESRVPLSEISMLTLENETVQVDGNFAILRSANIKFSVKKSSKKIIGTVFSGEGLLQTFQGTGIVWLAPTEPVYQKLNLGGVSTLERTANRHNRSR